MVLQFENINKSFGDKHVLQDISFKAESKKAFGLLGRNGAGKTTSIRILMDVFRADSGQILLDGKELNRKEIKLGYLPEERGLYPKKTIIEQLTYFAMLKGMDKKSAVKSIDYWLEKLGMFEHRNKKLITLSKGNQQKIQLITTIAHDPDIIILDEPFSGLDPVNAKLLEDIVKEQINLGKVVLFSSHQMNYIEEFCDNIAILNGGKIAIDGTIKGIKRSYPRNKLVVKSEDNNKILDKFEKNAIKNENDEIIITLPSENEKNTVMKYLVENYDIDLLKVYEPSLNDIFIQYTSDELKEGE